MRRQARDTPILCFAGTFGLDLFRFTLMTRHSDTSDPDSGEPVTALCRQRHSQHGERPWRPWEGPFKQSERAGAGTAAGTARPRKTPCYGQNVGTKPSPAPLNASGVLQGQESDVEKAGLVEPFAGPTYFLVGVQNLCLFDTKLSVR